MYMRDKITRNGLRDCVYDYIAFDRQMAIDEMPGNPLRYAASILRRIRREWDAMRFFNRKMYNDGFPAHADVINAREGDFGQRKRNVHQFSWNSIPTESACDGGIVGVFGSADGARWRPNSRRSSSPSKRRQQVRREMHFRD